MVGKFEDVTRRMTTSGVTRRLRAFFLVFLSLMSICLRVTLLGRQTSVRTWIDSAVPWALCGVILLVAAPILARLRRSIGFVRWVAGCLGLWTVSFGGVVLVHSDRFHSLSGTVRSMVSFGLLAPEPLSATLPPGLVVVATCLLGIIGARRTAAESRVRRVDLSTLGIASFVLAGQLLGGVIIDLIARQYVERVRVDPTTGSVTNVTGPITPIVIWVILTVAAVGVLAYGPFLVVALRSTTAMKSTIARLRMPMASLWIVSIAFAVRVATLLSVAPTKTDGGDPLFYHVTANLLAHGRGFPEPLNFVAYQRWIPSALHGPAYPVILSLSSRLGGTSYFDHKFLSILIGTGVVALTMVLAARIVPDPHRRSATLIAGCAAAVYPNLWIVDSIMFPEGLMALFTLGLVLSSYRWISRPSYRSAAVIGLCLGASALTRGEGVLLALLLVVPVMIGARNLPLRRRLLHIGSAALACLLLVGPWTLRNNKSFDVFVPLSTNGNELFVYANCPEAYDGKFLGFWLFQCQEDLRATSGEPSGDEAEKSLYWRRQGFEYAGNHLGELPKVLAARVARQWELFRPLQNTEFAPIEGRNKDAARLGLMAYFAMLPCALVGLIWLRRRRIRLLPIGAVAACITLTAAYAYGTTRFRVPFEPLLCLLAAVGLSRLLLPLRRRWASSDTWIRPNVMDRVSTHACFVHGDAPIAMTRTRMDRLKDLVPRILVALGVAGILPALYRATGSSMEEGFMLVFPELVIKGAIANVDFLHLYGPGSLHWLSLWFRTFGESLQAERTFGLLQNLSVVSALMVLTRPWGRLNSACVGFLSLVFVFTPIGLQALAWNGAVGLGLWSVIFAIRGFRRSSPPLWIASGLIAGLSLTFRPDIVVALVLGIGWLVVKRRRFFLSFAGGIAVGLTSMWIHLVQAGPRAVWRGIVLDPVFHLRGGRELPRPPSWNHLDGALQVISEKFAPWWGLPHLSAPKQLVIWFFMLPVLALVNVVVARRMHPFRHERPVLLAASLFGFGLLPQAIQRPDSAHLLWVSAITIPLFVVTALEMVRRRSPRSHPRVQLLTGVGVVTALIVCVIPFYTARTYADAAIRSLEGDLPVREVRRSERNFYLGDERPWRATLEVVADLDKLAHTGERLFVGPVDLRQTAYSDAFFYHLFPDLIPATYFIEMDPGLANTGSRLATDLSSADWLILTRFWSGWIEPNSSVIFGSDRPNQIVEDSFCLRASYQNDLVRLYHRCSHGDGIGPYEGPYRPEYDYAVEVLVPVPRRPDGTCTPTCEGKPSSTGIEIGIDTSVVN